MHVFSKKDLADARKLLAERRILSIVFSEGTYQVEVLSSKKPKEIVWPFLQISDSGAIIDAFCSCPFAEKKGSCVHLAAAFSAIMKDEPLHIRFQESLWNQMGLICADRHGYDVSCLMSADGGFEAKSLEGRRLFLIKALKPKAKKKLEEILFKRPIETEETSLKFSNLAQEELTLWREGRPSSKLSFELSFWSDLAKWLLMMQEEGLEYQLSFSNEIPPKLLSIEFPDLKIELSIEEGDWAKIIPTLPSVDSPLKVLANLQGHLKEIIFLKDKGAFELLFVGDEEPLTREYDAGKGIKLGDWLYVPKVGFIPRIVDPLLEQKLVLKHQVGAFFQHYLKLLQSHLSSETIHIDPKSLQYDLTFDKDQNLHISSHIFEKGDLQKEGAHYFGDWAYLPDKGFYKLKDQMFDESHAVFPKENISDFVNSYKLWLQGFEGFQTHVSGVESHLGFKINKDQKLVFFTKHEFSEEGEHIIDLGDWIYVEDKGFYSKVLPRPGALVKAGLEIEAVEISSFIHNHHEELESIPKFFSDKCPLERSGLHISFNKYRRIEIKPEFFFHEGYTSSLVTIYGDYTYVEEEGFFLIPHESRLPESYKTEKIIDQLSEPYFVSYELDLLYPHVLAIDSQLKRPKQMEMRLNGLEHDPSNKSGQWLLELEYESDIGHIPPHNIWKGIWGGKKYLFSEAGLLFLSDKRFDWLRLKDRELWLESGRVIRLTTLEFLRLIGIEEFLEPKGNSEKAVRTRELYNKFLRFEAPTQIDLTGLKSDLRAYQKTGVDWLWFLQSYGLSGLLCDEMGLGKTHQAMALICGIQNLHKKRKAKFLVVCPTSVIYHWEKLIQTFLPGVKPYIFHGIGRRFEVFSEDSYDLLLTSYGIVRTENKALSGCDFDLVVFDELQIAKNEKSLTHKALQNLNAAMRLGLSGTPIENRLLELKALFDLVVPTYLPPKAAFREAFIKPIEKKRDNDKRYMLSRLIHPFLLRRKKSEVLTELPEKIEEVVNCDLSDEQAKIYKKIIKENRDALLEGLKDFSKPPPIAHIFSMISRLKQVCDHPSLILKDTKNYKEYPSGKWDLFVELLNETRDSGQKLVVFTQYLGMLDIMGDYLKEHNIDFAQIRGSTRDRKNQVERFDQDPKCEVFLGSLQAAGVGIDLIAASVVIHYDRWWNPAKENQATDRVHRMGQKRGVQVFKLVTKNTIEEHIHHLIERKLSLASGVIGFDSHDQVKGLERQELIELLTILE